MPVHIASLRDVPLQVLPGRTLQWLVTRETLGAQNVAVAMLNCPPGSSVRPLHSHGDVEEVLLVLQGRGEAWVDGETASFRKGDALLLPAHSKHMIRNTGDEPLVIACIFAPQTDVGSYQLYDNPPGW